MSHWSIKRSIEAHWQTWQSHHFHLTKYAKELKKFYNKHEGQKCVIVGNGPSLTAQDLQCLYQNNIVTFATNRVYNIFDQTSWRPMYYASEDALILRDVANSVDTIPAKVKFIPVNLKWYENIEVNDATYFYMDYSGNHSETYNLSMDIAQRICCRGTVTISCIQLAIYMGFKEIYLLGVDHNYSRYINEQGEVVEDKSVKDYFSVNYDIDFKKQIMRDLNGTTKAFADVERLSRTTGKFRVYNATRGGKLEVFERVNFDDVFKIN